MEMTDSEKLLAEYVRENSDAAFGELVSRYLNLVYSTAFRLVSNDAHFAQDVTQAVFTDLARMAHTLSPYWTRTFSVARKYFANRPIWVFLSSPWTKRRPPGDSPTNQRVTFGLRCSLLSPPRVECCGRTHWVNGIDSVHCLRAIHSGQ
jgi:hypothetical protein